MLTDRNETLPENEDEFDVDKELEEMKRRSRKVKTERVLNSGMKKKMELAERKRKKIEEIVMGRVEECKAALGEGIFKEMLIFFREKVKVS